MKRFFTLGVPQGSLTSPLAWNVYFDSVLQMANRGPGKVVAYADDFTMSFAGHDPDIVRQITQDTITAVVEFGKDRGIVFNPGKTEVLHLGKDPKPEIALRELSMNGQSIP